MQSGLHVNYEKGNLLRSLTLVIFLLATASSGQLSANEKLTAQALTLNAKDTGYRGIWYMNQPSGDEYVYKYSGGLGTYCAKHKPFAIYCDKVEKTFFCYGGTTTDSNRKLLHMVSYYNHNTGMVPRPTILLNKKTSDAHDNPVISIDDKGYIWIFSTSHGTSRPSYVHKSTKPYDINEFELVNVTKIEKSQEVPMTNFSYMQPWYLKDKGFVCFFTRYNYPAARTICFMTSPDGVKWSKWLRLAAMDQGHYQISTAGKKKAGTAFNFHPQGKGLNWRTNLYYIETVDLGKTWQTAEKRKLTLPLIESGSPALVHDYQSEDLNVYLKDIRFDADERPIILFLTSKGYESGPKNNPRTWTTAHWTGTTWQIRPAFTSDNNYDMGSLYIENDGTWRIIGPTETGPQPYNPGGEMAMWVSKDFGLKWKKVKQLTTESPRNHTYARQPVNAHHDFYAIWADGHGRKPSSSSLYFCDKQGNVRVLPREMPEELVKPKLLGYNTNDKADLSNHHLSDWSSRIMKTKQIANQTVTFHCYNTIIVGSGAAGMNCAVHLCEFMKDKGIENPAERIAVVTAGLGLGASRMSGSDKQTYYKMGTSPDIADSAEEFAKSLTAAGCCHGDSALAEGIGSLREFYHLVQAGVPFPTDPIGTFIGYKTDHDPYERATSAGPKTSRFMSQCLQKQLEQYNVKIHNAQEAAHLLTVGSGESKRIAGIVTVDKKNIDGSNLAINVFLAANMILAAGGPGELFKTTVYPKAQLGIHGLAFKAGLIGANLTESQFGLASIKFRWNVSGTYMQAMPRLFSTNADGKDEKEFLTDFIPTMSKMATNIFLKGYQWPFDPQRIENLQSSLIDILVFNETQKGRRVFMDFLHNPVGNDSMDQFDIDALEPEAKEYLQKAGALQKTPIERLAHMNTPAIEIYQENGIDLYSEPLEIAVCAQHNNGGFAVDKWWQSNIPGTFIIGEMAGTHGVKRPGGSALNAGQTGGLRAAQYIVNVHGCELPDYSDAQFEIDRQLSDIIAGFERYKGSSGLVHGEVLEDIRSRMTASGGHIRELNDAGRALKNAVELYKNIKQKGFNVKDKQSMIGAIQAEHLALTSVAFLKAVVELLGQGSGSRGSHLVLAEDGVGIHDDVIDKATGKPLKFKPENQAMRSSILHIEYDESSPDLFGSTTVKLRPAPTDRKAFEPAWQDYREGNIYS